MKNAKGGMMTERVKPDNVFGTIVEWVLDNKLQEVSFTGIKCLQKMIEDAIPINDCTTLISKWAALHDVHSATVKQIKKLNDALYEIKEKEPLKVVVAVDYGQPTVAYKPKGVELTIIDVDKNLYDDGKILLEYNSDETIDNRRCYD